MFAGDHRQHPVCDRADDEEDAVVHVHVPGGPGSVRHAGAHHHTHALHQGHQATDERLQPRQVLRIHLPVHPPHHRDLPGDLHMADPSVHRRQIHHDLSSFQSGIHVQQKSC